MFNRLFFIVFFLNKNVYSQTCGPTSTSYLCSTAPSRTVGPTTAISPTIPNSAARCSLNPFQVTHFGQYAKQIRIHADQVFPPAPSASTFVSTFGKTSGAGAPTVPTSSVINENGIVDHVYGAYCGNAACTFDGNYFGRPNCACPTIEGNVPSSTYASPTPIPSPTGTPVAAPTYFGYKRSNTPTSTTDDAFYPTQVGYWIINADCNANNVANQRYIQIYQTSTGTLLSSSLKDYSGYGSLSITFGKQYDSIGTISDGVYLYCQGCEVGPIGSSYYCSFAAFRANP